MPLTSKHQPAGEGRGLISFQRGEERSLENQGDPWTTSLVSVPLTVVGKLPVESRGARVELCTMTLAWLTLVLNTEDRYCFRGVTWGWVPHGTSQKL